MTRPLGEVAQALLVAAGRLTTAARAPTLRELTQHACVGRGAARNTVANMRRSGLLVIVRQRHEGYRPRPVAEYAPGGPLGGAGGAGGQG